MRVKVVYNSTEVGNILKAHTKKTFKQYGPIAVVIGQGPCAVVDFEYLTENSEPSQQTNETSQWEKAYPNPKKIVDLRG